MLHSRRAYRNPAMFFPLLFLLVSCGSDNLMSPKVVGAWVLDNWGDAIVLSDDGTATYAFEDNGRPGTVRGTGTWRTDGDKLKIEVRDGYFEITHVEWEAGETLTATYWPSVSIRGSEKTRFDDKCQHSGVTHGKVVLVDGISPH